MVASDKQTFLIEEKHHLTSPTCFRLTHHTTNLQWHKTQQDTDKVHGLKGRLKVTIITVP